MRTNCTTKESWRARRSAVRRKENQQRGCPRGSISQPRSPSTAAAWAQSGLPSGSMPQPRSPSGVTVCPEHTGWPKGSMLQPRSPSSTAAGRKSHSSHWSPCLRVTGVVLFAVAACAEGRATAASRAATARDRSSFFPDISISPDARGDTGAATAPAARAGGGAPPEGSLPPGRNGGSSLRNRKLAEDIFIEYKCPQ